METIEWLKRDVLRLPTSFEFHYAKNNDRQRMAFFNVLPRLQFNYVVARSLDEQAFAPGALTVARIRSKTIAAWSVEWRNGCSSPRGAKKTSAGRRRIVYDECNDPAYVNIIKTEFRNLSSGRGVNEKLVRCIKPGKSKADPRIQLADMVCGGVSVLH